MATRTHPLATARAVTGGTVLALVLLASPGLTRSQTVTPPTPAAAEPTPIERLQRLVPASVGGWTRFALGSPGRGPDGEQPVAAEAEFRKQDWRVWMTVSESLLAVPPPATPIERRGSEGSERFYAEGGAAVRETVRAADGRVDVAVMRPDGLVVSIWGVMVAPAELKAIALAVARR